MAPTELDYITASPSPLLSPGLMRVILSSQWLTYAAARLVVHFMPHRVTTLLKPGDLKPGFCYVIAANHQSMFDPFIICSALPLRTWLRLRPFRFFAHNGLFESPLLRYTLLALGSFPASAHTRYASGIEAAASFLAHHQTVVIFPQGRRIQDKGRARSGVGVLAKMPNVGIIPARIEWQRVGRWQRSFQLVIGKPLVERDLSAQQILNRIYKLEVPAA